MQKDQIIQCEIESLAYGGRGVARLDGRVVFVERAVPGQIVKAQVTKVKKRFAEAVAVEEVRRSPQYVEPACRHFGECGGCLHQDLNYEVQLSEKAHQVEDAMRRIGGVEFAEILPALASPKTLHYRNKMEFAFSGQGEGLALGLRRRNGKTVVDVPGCKLMDPQALELMTEVAAFCRESNVDSWSPKTRAGFWRHLVVRRSETNGVLLAHLITAPDRTQADVGKALGEYLVNELGVGGFVHSTRKSALELAFGEHRVWSFGRDHLFERLNVGGRELRLRITAEAFFQPNTPAAELIYGAALDFAGLTGSEDVLDLYCGAGGLALAMAGGAGRVIGLDLIENAVRDGKVNAQENALTNCFFEAADLDGEGVVLPKADVVVVDPPRGGMSAALLASLRAMAPERIVAVSCDPPALARDVAQLGYAAERLVAVDQFPHTPHVECVALLRRPA
ncbi:MAG: 23S rRNA (uracil(1939)-C(5))-methyltransferase RlmD [Desulfovibrionaceae bacterium]